MLFTQIFKLLTIMLVIILIGNCSARRRTRIKTRKITNTKANTSTTDYCKKDLCYFGKHIACNNNGKFASTCPKSCSLMDVNQFKQLFIDEHNALRNKLASGKLPGFKSAGHMATMQWDDELQYLAELNVKTCQFAHDKCHNTDAHKMSGQSLAMMYGPSFEIKDVVKNSIDAWFNEYKFADMSLVKNFKATINFGKYGHFTELIVEGNSKLGCAVLQMPKQDSIEILVACDYGLSQIIDRPLYEPAKMASKCATGPNPKFPALCSLKEEFHDNE